MSKDVSQLKRELEKQGFAVERVSKKNSHYKVFSPEGKFVCFMPATPSDTRSLLNVIAELRRNGFKWKGR